MKIILFIIPVLLYSCTNGVNLEPVDYTSLFTDSNSKMWLVNKVVVDGTNITPFNTLDKDVAIFHSNGNCDYLPMKDIARKSPRKAYFLVDCKAESISIEFEDEENWIFNLGYMYEDSILLEPNPKSDLNISIQLKPFPEL